MCHNVKYLPVVPVKKKKLKVIVLWEPQLSHIHRSIIPILALLIQCSMTTMKDWGKYGLPPLDQSQRN